MARERAGKKELARKTCKSRDSKAQISLEDYLRFLHSRNYSGLCVNFLNQIISMHGYKKIHKSPKKVLAEAVEKLTLVKPSRSTLRERISPTASATIGNVVEDLEALNWQECTVTSVQALNAATSGLVIYTSPEPPTRHHADSSKGPLNRRKELVPIQNGGAVKKVGLGRPGKEAKRMKPNVAVMKGS